MANLICIEIRCYVIACYDAWQYILFYMKRVIICGIIYAMVVWWVRREFSKVPNRVPTEHQQHTHTTWCNYHTYEGDCNVKDLLKIGGIF